MNVRDLDIAKFLPHKPPFLMVDNVLSIDDNHVSTSFKIRQDCIFNDSGVLAEVGLVENAAQTCSSIVGKSYIDDFQIKNKKSQLIGFISAIKKIVIHQCPKIGSTIITNAYLKSRFDSDQYCICTLECTISSNNKELLSCELNLFIQELK